jgi:hypothetical protein
MNTSGESEFKIGQPPNITEVGVRRRVAVVEVRDIIGIGDRVKSG